MMGWFYRKYRPALILSIVMVPTGFTSYLWQYVLLWVVYPKPLQEPSQSNVDKYLMPPEPEVCPKPSYLAITPGIRYSPLFYWKEEHQAGVIEVISLYSPLYITVFSGLYSDKYGGRYAVLVGLVVSGSVATVLYLAKLKCDFVFLGMLVLSRIGEGITSAAVWSLVGKWAKPHERTMFVGIIFIGETIGIYIYTAMTLKLIDWKITCYVCGGLNFVVALWWWDLYRHRLVPKTRKFSFVPCKDILTSTSLYISSLLVLACIMFESFSEDLVMIFAVRVLYLTYRTKSLPSLALALSKLFAYCLCGAFSDYFIYRGLVSASSLRRCVCVVLLPFIFCALIVVRIARCDLAIVLASCEALQYIFAIFESTSYAVVLDLTPAYSGVVFGIIIWASRIICYKIRRLFEEFLNKPGSSDLKKWNELFFVLATVGSIFTIPFIIWGTKKTSWGNGVVLKSYDKNIPTVMKNSSVVMAETESWENVAGTSNRKDD